MVTTLLLTSLLIFLAIELMDMGKDTTAFKQRFEAYKNGKPVSEIYGFSGNIRGTSGNLDNTINFLKQHEGFRDTTYKDGSGIPTIGYGFTDPALVKKGKISIAEADARLRKEVLAREAFLSRMTNWDKLGEGAKTALRSYYYNYPAGFKDTTKFMQAWNAGNYAEAIRQVDAGWNDTNNPGLRTRREREQALLKADPFLMSMQQKPMYQTTAAQLNAERQFQPWSNYHGTDYPVTNPAPASISSWNSPQSPSYTPAQLSARRSYLKLPNIEDVIENTTWKPSFKNGKLPGFRVGTVPFVDEEKQQKQEDWADQWQERLKPSAKSKVVQKWNATGQKPKPESSEEYTKHRIKETTWKKPSGRKMLDSAIDVVDFVPVAGDVKQALEASKSTINGDYSQAVLFGAGMAMPTMFRKHGKNLIKKAFSIYDNSDISRTATLASIAGIAGLPGTYDIITGDNGMDYLSGVAKTAVGFGLGWQGGQKLIKYLEPRILRKYYGIHRPSVDNMPKVSKNSITSEALFDEPWYTNEDRVKATQSLIRHNYDKLKSGDSYALISDNALSTDSAPLYFAQLARHSNIGSINAVRDNFGNITMARLNNYGAYRTMDDINRSIDLLNKVYPGIPYSKTTGSQIYVPQLYMTKYKNGKPPIHINPANRGKFNATKQRTGKTTEELSHSKNPLTRKRAIFALNARKWKH